jgi:hypothetical protein
MMTRGVVAVESVDLIRVGDPSAFPAMSDRVVARHHRRVGEGAPGAAPGRKRPGGSADGDDPREPDAIAAVEPSGRSPSAVPAPGRSAMVKAPSVRHAALVPSVMASPPMTASDYLLALFCTNKYGFRGFNRL